MVFRYLSVANIIQSFGILYHKVAEIFIFFHFLSFLVSFFRKIEELGRN